MFTKNRYEEKGRIYKRKKVIDWDAILGAFLILIIVAAIFG